MKPGTWAVLDACSAALLSLWALAAIFALVSGSLDPMKQGRWLDQAAWIAFGGALLLSFGSRWLAEVTDEAPIGPLRLWSAAALAALVVCMASAFLVTARWRELAMLDPQHLNQTAAQALSRARSLSIQFFILRALLALGLAATIKRLPRRISA